MKRVVIISGLLLVLGLAGCDSQTASDLGLCEEEFIFNNKVSITVKVWFDGVYWATVSSGAQDRRDTEQGNHTVRVCNAQNESLCDSYTVTVDACTEFTFDYVY